MSPFQGVNYSLWFFRVYFFISLVGAMIITLIKPKIRKYLIASCFIGIFIITFWAPKSIGEINIGIELGYVLFYLFFYMLGYHMKDKEISIFQLLALFLATILGIVAIAQITQMNVLEIESHKFLPDFIFMLWSLFGVYIVVYLKKYFKDCKRNVLSIIGENSLYIFLAQGVGSSVLYWISEYIVMEWYYKIWIMFGINLIVTAIVTILIKLLLDFIGKPAKKILKEKIYN